VQAKKNVGHAKILLYRTSIYQSINQSNQSLFNLKTKPWQGREAKSNEQ